MEPLPVTSYSLLARLAEPADATAWSEFLEFYQETIFRYSCSHGLQEADALDVVQQVLIAVHHVAARWQPSDRPASFRTWLIRTSHLICLRTLRDRDKHDRAIGGSTANRRLHELLSEDVIPLEAEREWRKWAFCWAAGRVEREVEPTTWQAFWQTAVEGGNPSDVARRLDMRVGSVYAAKCRVLARIRDHVQELSRREQ